MTMLTSLFTAVSGLGSNGQALSVIGDNIANVNTSGFKGSRANFGDILSQSLGGGGNLQVGRGSRVGSIQQLFGQGTVETTGNPLDLAIDGDGFFTVLEPGGAQFYTRAGQFSVDRNGFIINPSRNFLLGFQADGAGNITANIDRINVATVNSPPNASTGLSIQANLDSRETVPLVPWSLSTTTGPAAGSYNFASAITVYDTLGNSHLTNIYYRKTAPNSWNVYATYNDSATGTNYVQVPAGSALTTLTFNTAGQLTAPLLATNGTFDFSAWGATAAQSIGFNFGYNSNFTTQYGSPSSTIFQTQDGYTSGSLRALTVSDNGIMSGVFTNGQVRDIAQVVLARFTAPTELSKMGKNLFAESNGSGQPLIGEPGTSGRGSISSSSLEAGNVDLAEEFVRLIAAQRGFQANTKVITTTDELLNELLAIKR